LAEGGFWSKKISRKKKRGQKEGGDICSGQKEWWTGKKRGKRKKVGLDRGVGGLTVTEKRGKGVQKLSDLFLGKLLYFASKKTRGPEKKKKSIGGEDGVSEGN